MRRTSIFSVFVAAIMSVALFYLKYEVKNLEGQLNKLNHSIISDREAVHVLKAEWSHLNDLDRLKDLAIRRLKLQETDPRQIKETKDLSHVQVVNDPDLEVIGQP